MPDPTPAQLHSPTTSPPWWRFGHVWLVIAGPAIVVVAGFATLWIAIAIPDPVLTGDHYSRAASAGQPGSALVPRNLSPAQQARNHAATPPAPAP